MDPLNKCTEQNQEISPAPVFDLNSNLLKKGTAVLAVPFLYCRRNSASIPILLKALFNFEGLQVLFYAPLADYSVIITPRKL